MQKEKASPITIHDLLEFLKSDSSFDFEMRVRHLFVSRQLKCQHGGTYVDPNMGKPRQFDLRVEIPVPSDPRAVPVRVILAVECKSLSECGPMLVCRSPRSEHEAGHHVIAQTNGNRQEIVSWLNQSQSAKGGDPFPTLCTLETGNQSRYKQGDPVGKSLDVVTYNQKEKRFKSSDTNVYDKWTQSLQSASAVLLQLKNEPLQPLKNQSCVPLFRFTWIVPILVVPDSRLYAVDYDDSGAMNGDPHEIDQTAYYVDYKPVNFESAGPQFKFKHFEIMTYKGLEDFVSKITGDDAQKYVNEQINPDACRVALCKM